MRIISAKGDPPERTLGGVVAEANPSIGEEAAEGVPTLEHVVHGLADLGARRHLGAVLEHPGSEIGDQRRTQLLARRRLLGGAQAIDRPLDGEDGVDALHGFQGEGRDHLRGLALSLAPRGGLDVGQLEELAPTMRPAGGFQDLGGLTLSLVELIVTVIGVGLQDAAPVLEVALRVRAAAVA